MAKSPGIWFGRHERHLDMKRIEHDYWLGISEGNNYFQSPPQIPLGEGKQAHVSCFRSSLTCLWPGACRLTGQGILPNLVVAARESGHKSHKSLASFTNKASLAAPKYARDCQRRRRNPAFLTSPWPLTSDPSGCTTIYPGVF